MKLSFNLMSSLTYSPLLCDPFVWDAFEDRASSAVQPAHSLTPAGVFPPFEKVAPQETTSEVDYGAIDQWLTSVLSSSSRNGLLSTSDH
eukprot:scaffold6325_cov159-Ochromonas_danica.AAC.1